MDIGDDGGLVVTMIITNVILDRRIGKGAATALSFEIRGSFVFTFKDVKGGTYSILCSENTCYINRPTTKAIQLIQERIKIVELV